jgi:CubicO group peptidase (beta-lactamase class C family)
MSGTGQETRQRIERETSRLLDAGVAGQVFPGAVACIAWRDGDGDIYVDVASGFLRAGDAAVKTSTRYDLASLTKPFVATAALRLVAFGKLTLDVRTDAALSDVRGGTGGSATLRALLGHRAGLAAWGGLYLDVPHEPGTQAARRWILSEASRRSHDTWQKPPVYSDLGYIIAGEVVARSGGDKLDKVVAREVTIPLGISEELFYAASLPPDRRSQLAREAAPTEWCEWRQRFLRGEVQDENCAAFGGVAGNAGMFGTARAVAAFGRAVLDVYAGRGDLLPRDLLMDALTSPDESTLLLGWEGKSPEESSAGRRMSPKSFGHLGFTGTSIWCDPERDVAVVLLTNRVHPSRANERIKGFRPGFHDGVIAALGK